MKSDRRKDLVALDRKSFKEIEVILRRMDYDTQDMVSSFVASICNVDVADMLSSSNNLHLAQSRSLYWYAMRYLTKDTYQRISERSKLDGHAFSPESIAISIPKMTELIENDSVWKRRWVIVRRMLNLLQDPQNYNVSDFTNPSPQKYKILLQVPSGTRDDFEVSVVESNKQ